MKALIIVHNDRVSGVATFAMTTVKGLQRLGWECDLLVLNTTSEKYFERVGISAKYLPHYNKESRLRTMIHLWRIVRKGGYSVCHSTSMRPTDVLAIRLAGKRPYGSLHTFARGNRASFSVGVASLFASRFACVSNYQASTIRKWFIRKPIVIREGAFGPQHDHVFGNNIVVVSRLVPFKGLDGIAEWSMAVNAQVGCETLVWGDGELREGIAATAPHCLHINGNELDTDLLYNRAAIVVILSEIETFCRPAMEAAMRGVPIVCRSELPAVKEMLGMHAFYGDGTVETLVSLILKVKNSWNYHKQGEALKTYASARHNYECQISDLMKLWEISN